MKYGTDRAQSSKLPGCAGGCKHRRARKPNAGKCNKRCRSVLADARKLVDGGILLVSLLLAKSSLNPEHNSGHAVSGARYDHLVVRG